MALYEGGFTGAAGAKKKKALFWRHEKSVDGFHFRSQNGSGTSKV
jgi:hypothetical protein